MNETGSTRMQIMTMLNLGSGVGQIVKAEIEKILKNAEVVDSEDTKDNSISLGCTVTIYDEEFKEEVEYKIVGSTEANIAANKISNESPIGKALIGKKKGQKITVDSPSGELKFKILKVTR